MKLPVEFIEKMKSLLSNEEFEQLIDSYDMPRFYGLRVNTLKISVEDFLKISPFELEPVPWTRDGFYYKEGCQPGKHPFYYAGLYYIQEPSAMLPGAVLDAGPGEMVLDLCAAPGGKTVQIAAGMKGKGILFSNDISADRVKALVKNIELCGITNAVVLNENPENLSRRLSGFFDKIIVDAPCSGEGMFRKDESAARSWGKYKNELCSGMQRDIMKYADIMLKPGGSVVYSTCTFSPEENECIISEFLSGHKEYEAIDIPKTAGIQGGRPQWGGDNAHMSKAARLWPFLVKGEGHFTARMKKAGEGKDGEVVETNAPPEIFREFESKNLNTRIEGHFDLKGENLYYLPRRLPDLSGIRVSKFGWYLGKVSGKNFEPSHSMIAALKKDQLKNVLDYEPGSREIQSYLKGETLVNEAAKGLYGICAGGYTLGWGKHTGDILKNLYPKGWRKLN